MDPCVPIINNTHLNDSTSSSSDAADVLIGSTRVHVDPSRVKTQHRGNEKVNIALVSFEDDRCTDEDEPLLNKPPASKAGNSLIVVHEIRKQMF